jgi:hypothetical protein
MSQTDGRWNSGGRGNDYRRVMTLLKRRLTCESGLIIEDNRVFCHMRQTGRLLRGAAWSQRIIQI